MASLNLRCGVISAVGGSKVARRLLQQLFRLTESWNFGSFLQRAIRSQTERAKVMRRAITTKKRASQFGTTRVSSGASLKGIWVASNRAPARATVGKAIAHSSISYLMVRSSMYRRSGSRQLHHAAIHHCPRRHIDTHHHNFNGNEQGHRDEGGGGGGGGQSSPSWEEPKRELEEEDDREEEGGVCEQELHKSASNGARLAMAPEGARAESDGDE